MTSKRILPLCSPHVPDPITALIHQATKARKKGKTRREVIALRHACALAEHNAELWTLLAMACVRLKLWDEALQALQHALWLRTRAGDSKRAEVTRRLLLDVAQQAVSTASAA